MADPKPVIPLRSRRSAWFFGLLAILAALGLTIPIVYNLSLQLTLDQVTAARRLWRKRGPKDYDLAYAEKIDPSGSQFYYQVQVRDGRVTAFSCNGVAEPVQLGGDYQAHSIDGLFEEIEAALKADRDRGGRRNYVAASFDKVDGHPHRYIRRETGTRNRLEWNVKPLVVPNK